MGRASGDSIAIGEFGDGVEASTVVLDEALALLVHGNTFPGHGWHLLLKEVLPMSCYKVLPMSCYKPVTYVPDPFDNQGAGEKGMSPSEGEHAIDGGIGGYGEPISPGRTGSAKT